MLKAINPPRRRKLRNDLDVDSLAMVEIIVGCEDGAWSVAENLAHLFVYEELNTLPALGPLHETSTSSVPEA